MSMFRRLLQHGRGVRLLTGTFLNHMSVLTSIPSTLEKSSPPSMPPILSTAFFHDRPRFCSTSHANLTSLAQPTSSESDSDSSSESEDEMKGHRHEAVAILRSLNAYNFREHLIDLSHQRTFIRYNEMVKFAQEKGVATNRAESRELCDTLIAAGVVFRFGDVVYLCSDEVADTILASLPDAKADSEKHVEQIQRELQPLEEKKKYYDKKLEEYRNRMLLIGLFLLVAQFGIFVRLTFWELSWDVMEPASYFVSLTYGIMFYAYFIFTRENFEIPSVLDRLAQYFAVRKNFSYDKERYKQLLKELHRFQRRGLKSRL